MDRIAPNVKPGRFSMVDFRGRFAPVVAPVRDFV
jgi:hypothetical protein